MSYEAAIQFVSLASVRSCSSSASARSGCSRGDLSVGEFVAFNALVLLANGPILVLLAIWDELQYSTVLLNRLNDIVEQEPEQGADHAQLTRGARRLEGRIELAGPRLSVLARSRHLILDGITLDVEPGTMVALVGRSGSGKTTLVRVPRGPARGRPTGTISSTASTCARSTTATCAGRSATSSRRTTSSTTRSRATSPSATSEPDMRARRLGGAGGERARVRRAPAARLRDADRRDRASCSPAASGSGSRSRARSTGARRCSSSTRRRARSTPSRSARCRRTWTRSSRGERPS